ncbi:unnamed protein product [Ixodes pacificus]
MAGVGPAPPGYDPVTPGAESRGCCREQRLLLLMLTTACVVNLAVTGVGVAYLRLHFGREQVPQSASPSHGLRALLLPRREAASGGSPGKRPARLRRQPATLATLRPRLFHRPRGYGWL